MKRIIIIAVLFMLLAAGCTHLSVGHLQKNPLHLNQAENLSMRYWDFQYVSTVENGRYAVTGIAYPKTNVMPGWGEWLHDFWLSVYLSDDRGMVLASDMKVYPTQKVDPEGVQFEFSMSPERMPAARDIFVTFGYRMSLTESRFRGPTYEKPLTGEQSVFFASEGALAR